MSDALKIELGRRYKFSASHRLHSEQMSAEENERVYGKCNNPYGHGHNYVLEVSMSAEVDTATGMIANLSDLDEFVHREVIERFDQKSMNEDMLEFRGKVPTTEIVCMEIYQRLRKFPKAKLQRVRVEETTNNAFEYAGESADHAPVQEKGNNR